MAVGYPVTSTDLNNRAGAAVVQLWDALDNIRSLKLWLDDHNDAYLNGIGITGSASTGDVKTLRDAVADLGGTSGLWAVSHGTFTPAGVNNYFFNAKQLTGATWAG